MELIGKSKVTKNKINEHHTYPLVRLPETHLDLTGNTMHIFETTCNGKRALVLYPDEDFDGEIVQSSDKIIQYLSNIVQSNNDTQRLDLIEQKLETILEALKIDNGPDEIRTHDPRRVKAMS
ncbi:MAG: hypothetical protein PWP63_1640 [Methanolobus sp.]|nr:hypothetical protein [Methanolobus sp.]